MSKEAVNFKIEDEQVSGSFKNVFDQTKRDFATHKNFEMKAGDYAVFER
jgi:hypothetical protein